MDRSGTRPRPFRRFLRSAAPLALLLLCAIVLRGNGSCDGGAVPVEEPAECAVDAECTLLVEYEDRGDGLSALWLSDDPARGPLCSAAGQCVACLADDDCGAGERCDAGACVPDCADDAADATGDDTPETAGALDAATLTGTSFRACPGDVDWFCTDAATPVAAGTTLDVTLRADLAAGDADAALYVIDDASGAAVRLDAALGDPAAAEQLLIRAERPGRYCVRVTATGDEAADYELGVSLRPPEEGGHWCTSDADCAPAGCRDDCPVCLDLRCVQHHPAPDGAPDPLGGEWRRDGARFVPRCPATSLLVFFSAAPDPAFVQVAVEQAGVSDLGGFPALVPVFPAAPAGQAPFPEVHRLVLQTELGPNGQGVLTEDALWRFATAISAEPFAGEWNVTGVELDCRVVVALGGTWRPRATYADDFQPGLDPTLRYRHRRHTRLATGDDGTATTAVAPAGGGARVGLLDTGVDRRVVGAGHGIDATDGATGHPSRDRFGHGTHMAGLLREVDAAVTSYRVLDGDGRGTFGQLAWGLASAAYAGERVLNLSVGWAPRFGESRLVRAALDRLADAYPNVLVVAAAGNREFTPVETTTLFYPAAHRADVATLLVVDGVRPDDRPIVLAISGVEADLVAPAQLAYAPWPGALVDRPPTTRGAVERGLTGTSVAAAQVSAAAANLLNADGDLTAAELEAALVAGAALLADAGVERGRRLDHCGALAEVRAAPDACDMARGLDSAIADGAFVDPPLPADYMGPADVRYDAAGETPTTLDAIADLLPAGTSGAAAVFGGRFVTPQPIDPGGIDGLLDPTARRLDGTIKPDFPQSWVGDATLVVIPGTVRPYFVNLGPATSIRVADQIRVVNLPLTPVDWTNPDAAAFLAIRYRTSRTSTALSVTELRVDRQL